MIFYKMEKQLYRSSWKKTVPSERKLTLSERKLFSQLATEWKIQIFLDDIKTTASFTF